MKRTRASLPNVKVGITATHFEDVTCDQQSAGPFKRNMARPMKG